MNVENIPKHVKRDLERICQDYALDPFLHTLVLLEEDGVTSAFLVRVIVKRTQEVRTLFVYMGRLVELIPIKWERGILQFFSNTYEE